jgi:Raf kinase inhibitor-like YbhB/YbcL family protein
MLEKIPAGVGHALRGVRAGLEKIVSESEAFAAVPQVIVLESAAFEHGDAMPARYTADGAKISPPLAWSGPLADAQAFALVVEDPDAPAAEPLVHLLAWNLPPTLRQLSEGQFRSPHHEGLDDNVGRNSFLSTGWLPPDPPPGHGAHRYVFQIFALDQKLDLDGHPGRKAVVEAMTGHVLAKGLLVGVYAR